MLPALFTLFVVLPVLLAAVGVRGVEFTEVRPARPLSAAAVSLGHFDALARVQSQRVAAWELELAQRRLLAHALADSTRQQRLAALALAA